MNSTSLSAAETKRIEDAVSFFIEKRDLFETTAVNLQNTLVKDARLRELVHSSKYRVKDAGHLRDKLTRKTLLAKNASQESIITRDNLFSNVVDLAGVRLLHLHTDQFAQIDLAIKDVLAEFGYQIVEGPIANTWDDEYREFFRSLGVETAARSSLYTSVHYVVDTRSRSEVRCELQVRTLLEEVWGEVSHQINYPHETESIATKEQLKVLARVTSSGTRLVDSIFKSRTEFDAMNVARPTASPKQ